MKSIKFLSITLLLGILFAGCTKFKYDDVSFVETATDPAKLSALFDITQDNTGMVTIYPNGEGVAYFNVYFGDGTAAPVKIMPGASVQRKYAEGLYDVRIVGVGVTGKTAEATQKLTVSFKAPEKLEVTATVDAASAFKINVSATALYETLFKVYWGDVANEVPVSFLEGVTVSHTYAKSGDYVMKVVALSGGVATTTFTKTITIKVPILLPLDFETVGQTYAFNNFGGGDVAVIDNPKSITGNTSAKVGRMIKNAGEVYGGSLITLSSPIDFSANKFMRLKVFSPRVGAKVLLKVENSGNGGINFEKEVATTVANQWEDLVFDFNAINTSNSYNNVVLIFDLGTAGNGTANFTFYFDDLRQVSTIEELVLPLTFESAELKYNFVNFGGGDASIVANPYSNASNASTKVGKMVKNAGEVWGGSLISLAKSIDFSANKIMRMKVYSPRVGAKVLLKVENSGNGGINFEKEAATTVANQWEDLAFDFSAINTSNTYQNVVLIFELGTVGNGSSNFTFYFDDIRQAGALPTIKQINLPVDFDAPGFNYEVTDFGNNNTVDGNDPVNSGNKVKVTTKPNGAETWAGTTIGTPAGFSTAIPFSAVATQMTMRIYSPAKGIPVRLKVEDNNDPTKSVETEVKTTVANAWETLTFDFSNQAAGTAAINFTYKYNKASVFFDFGTAGSGKVFYWDDVKCSTINATVPTLGLPLTFESTSLNYAFTDFNGGNVTVVANPNAAGINLSSKVAKMVKGPGEVYGGSYITLDKPIDFSAGKTVKVKVYSPRVGAKLLFKVENLNDGGINFEKEVLTTKAGAWEELTFDYSAINTTKSYQKVVVIFDLGTVGDGSSNFTFYFDDITLN
jgi:hypothetical protein